MGNACYHAVWSPTHWLYKNVNIKVYKNIILPPVLLGRETWSHTLREEQRLRVSQKRVNICI
jgi:hypothetical protein